MTFSNIDDIFGNMKHYMRYHEYDNALIGAANDITKILSRKIVKKCKQFKLK